MSYLSVDGVHALLHLEKEDQKSDSTDEVILVLKEGKVAMEFEFCKTKHQSKRSIIS